MVTIANPASVANVPTVRRDRGLQLDGGDERTARDAVDRPARSVIVIELLVMAQAIEHCVPPSGPGVEARTTSFANWFPRSTTAAAPDIAVDASSNWSTR